MEMHCAACLMCVISFLLFCVSMDFRCYKFSYLIGASFLIVRRSYVIANVFNNAMCSANLYDNATCILDLNKKRYLFRRNLQQEK